MLWNRRQFIKGSLALAASAALPPGVEKLLPSVVEPEIGVFEGVKLIHNNRMFLANGSQVIWCSTPLDENTWHGLWNDHVPFDPTCFKELEKRDDE